MWKNFGFPLLFIAAVAVVFGWPLSYFLGVPLWQGCAGILALLLGAAVYVLGEFRIYDYAAKRLGYRCELRPDPLPPSAGPMADLVIRGDISGRAFALYRERHTSSGRSGGTVWSAMEWTVREGHLADFELHLTSAAPSQDATARFAQKLASALHVFRESDNAMPSVKLAFDHPIASRATLTASDAEKVRALFTPAVCDALDQSLSAGWLRSRDGLLVFRETCAQNSMDLLPPASRLPWVRKGKFPFPWDIGKYVERGDRLCRLFVP
jgi:hypothetical protein